MFAPGQRVGSSSLSGENGSAESVQNPVQSQLPLTGCLGK
jgi:hypothetical protein